jgi:hypothetical protein
MKGLLSAVLCLAFNQIVSGELGSGLWRTYTKNVVMPTTASDATSMGWATADASDCVDGLGIKWGQNSDGQPSQSKPIVLYYTPNGQLSAIGTVAYGAFNGTVVDEGYWEKIGDEEYFISVTTRDPSVVCDASYSDDNLIGDRVLINANSLGRSIPLTQSDAISQNYETGACFASMGTHSFYDVAGVDGAMTWESMNLMPVVPMYDRNNNFNLNAIFFTTPWIQQSMFNANQWEPVFLVDYLMCQNWCDDSCGWDDTHAWSTMHFYFSDPTTITCENGCKIGCCETD